VYLVTTVLFLIATALDGFFPKLVRILYSTISFTPIVVGFFITKLDRKVVYSFFLIVIVFLGINLLAGSRGYIAIVGITFTLGFLANKENNKFRLVFFITSTVVAIVIFPLLSFLEVFRQINDRIGFDEVDKNRLATLVDAYWNQSAEINNDDGLARLITWPNLSVILLTDVSVKAVGLSNLDNDIKFIFTNTFFTGKSVEEAREQHIENLWGTAPTNLYDYNVTLTNSVEFSLMADGIWRYGKYGFIYNLIIIISITLLIESFVLKSIVYKSFTTFKLFILCYMYLLNYNLINVEPLFSVLRSILYNLVFSLIFTTMINLYIFRKNERVNTLDHGPM
jgi:hypothetical protein